MNKKLNNRFVRLEGQLRKLHESIDEGKDCSDIIPQFLAVKGALVGAYEEYIKGSLDSCAKDDEKKIKRLISQLVKL